MARATIEVQVTRKLGKLYYRHFVHEEWKPLFQVSRVKPLDDDAREMLDPRREWVETTAKKLHHAFWLGSTNTALWDVLDDGSHNRWYQEAREVAKMIAESLERYSGHIDDDRLGDYIQEIKELEAMAKGTTDGH